MKVLLTGASGFLGRYALARLHQQGIPVVAIGRHPPPGLQEQDFIQQDLLSTQNLTEAIAAVGATHLLHLAWYAEHGKFWTSPENLRWVEATRQLTEAFCRTSGKRVVVAGTCAEYDWTQGYCREDVTPLVPATPYGSAKNAAHRLTAAICSEYQLPCAWARIFLPYGHGEDRRRLVPSLIDVFACRRAPFGVNAAAYRDFLHAADVASALVTLMLSDATGAYNVSSGMQVEIGSLVREIAAQMNTDPSPVLDLATERIGDPPLLVGENTKLKALGWQPRYGLTEGLQHTIANLAEDGLHLERNDMIERSTQ